MKEKNEPTKIVKGGFRATLALIFSIIALVLAILAYNRSGDQADLQSDLRELQQKMDKVKQETTELVKRVKEETTKAVKNMAIELKKKDNKPTGPEKE
jgi:cell division protein FtsL